MAKILWPNIDWADVMLDDPSARRQKYPRKSLDAQEDFNKLNILKESMRVRFQLYGGKNFEKEWKRALESINNIG